MKNEHEALSEFKHHVLGKSEVPQSIDWYSPGQTRFFEVEGVLVSVRLIGRNGRRSRIAINLQAESQSDHARSPTPLQQT